MSERKYSILSQIFNRLVENRLAYWYDAPDFPSQDDMPIDDAVRWPRAKGDKCYADEVTAFRLLGADPVFPRSDTSDVPQPLIDAFRASFMEGLREAFPDHAVKDYIEASLTEDSFSLQSHGIHEHFYGHILRQFPRILKSAPQKTERKLGESLEHDVRRGKRADKHDITSAARTDRKHLTNADLLRTYKTLQAHPEIAVAFLYWQDIIEEYASALGYMLQDEHLGAGKAEGAGNGNVPWNILDYFPIYNVVRFVGRNIDVATIPVFFIAGAVAQMGKRDMGSATHNTPSPEDYKDGATQIIKRGVFLRRFDTEYGERQVVCPFGPFGARWLNMELTSGQTAIEACIEKITLEEELNPRITALMDAARRAFTELLERSDQKEIKRLEAATKIIDAETKVCPYGHGTPKAP